MKRKLAEAVIAAFHDEDAEVHRARLAEFSQSDWFRSYKWLDASGMALYFVARIKDLAIENALPAEIVQRLERNLADSRARTKDMFQEFARLNTEFQSAGLRYANLKGFTLAPEYCTDPALRLQLDFDFLFSRADAQKCQDALERLDYLLTAVHGNVLEFKAGASRLPSVRDLYKAKPQRTVEIHFDFLDEGPTLQVDDDRLSRRRLQTLNGFAFPALSRGDQFLAQSVHLFKHIRDEWTRFSWFLEYRECVRAHRKDECFWQEVRECASRVADSATAIGAVTLLASKALGEFAPPDLSAWTVDGLPPAIRLWIEHYGAQILLANFPGTKLYLLLEGELAGNKQAWSEPRHRKLLPLHRVAPVTYSTENDGTLLRMKGWLTHARYVLFRLTFHLTQNFRYMAESYRWKRILAGSRE